MKSLGVRRRRRGIVALCLLSAGALLVTAGAASASSLVGASATVTFWNNNNVVTVQTPSMCPTTPANPTGAPTCTWMLFVNEPDIPAQTVVGSAIGGLSAILTVPYPTNFCGVIQADVLVGPPPWRLLYGHQASIQTGNCSCSNGQATTPSSSSTASSANALPGVAPASAASASGQTTAASASGQTSVGLRGASSHRRGGARTASRARPSRHRLTTRTGDQTAGAQATPTTTTQPAGADGTQVIAQTGACSPITGGTQTVPASSVPFTGDSSTVAAPATTATLPFTGLDVKPLAIAGMVLIVFGLGTLTTVDQRRLALRRAGQSVRTSRAAAFSTFVARWFLGD